MRRGEHSYDRKYEEIEGIPGIIRGEHSYNSEYEERECIPGIMRRGKVSHVL